MAYLVGITDVDSIRFNLMFERFLNPERVSMPDFDTDFCYDRRGEVIEYVSEKYGRDHVCQIITYNTLAAKAAVRDCGRALGMSYSEVDAVASLGDLDDLVAAGEAIVDGFSGKVLEIGQFAVDLLAVIFSGITYSIKDILSGKAKATRIGIR